MKLKKKLTIEELNRPSVDEFKAQQHFGFAVVLDNVRSLNNVGSMFRTADAMNFEKVVLCGGTGTPPSPELHKTALGAEDSMKWEYYVDTLEAIASLKREGYVILAVEQAANSVMLQDYRFDAQKRYAIVMGNEVKGVQQSVVDSADECIELPQWGTKHSMNVSVTAGMMMWEAVRQTQLGGK